MSERASACCEFSGKGGQGAAISLAVGPYYGETTNTSFTITECILQNNLNENGFGGAIYVAISGSALSATAVALSNCLLTNNAIGTSAMHASVAIVKMS